MRPCSYSISKYISSPVVCGVTLLNHERTKHFCFADSFVLIYLFIFGESWLHVCKVNTKNIGGFWRVASYTCFSHVTTWGAADCMTQRTCFLDGIHRSRLPKSLQWYGWKSSNHDANIMWRERQTASVLLILVWKASSLSFFVTPQLFRRFTSQRAKSEHDRHQKPLSIKESFTAKENTPLMFCGWVWTTWIIYMFLEWVNSRQSVLAQIGFLFYNI